LLHTTIVNEVVQRARASKAVIDNKVPIWNKLERSLTAYVPLDEAERHVKATDARKPVSVVVPVSFAVLETLLTYNTSAFLTTPLFKYRGVGPEDQLSAALLEQIIEVQSRRNKFALALYTMWRDSFVYGFGVCTPTWEVQYGKVRTRSGNGMLATMTKMFGLGTGKDSTIEQVIFEGNVLSAIDPYRYLFDPGVPVSEPQKGEFVGWCLGENYPKLLSREEYSDGSFFNVKYLKDKRAKSTIWMDNSSRDPYNTGSNLLDGSGAITSPIDVIYMYINIIPKDWGLGSREYPEKWLFAIGGEEYVLQAEPVELDHNMFPVVVYAPDSTGHSLLPTSKLEMCHGIQEVIDWMISTHITNIRKAINDMLVVDPLRIHMASLRNPGPGKLIILRQSAWGQGIDNAIKQLPVTDVTQQHIQEIPFLLDIIQRTTGSVDILQGIMHSGGERRSAEEARSAKSGAVSRLATNAQIGMMQAHWDLQRMIASQTQQFTSKETWIRVVGRLQEVLIEEYGYTPGSPNTVFTKPEDLQCDLDIIPADSGQFGGESPELWVQLLQIAASSPELAQKNDIYRLFLHAAQVGGAKNIDDFARRPNPMQATVQSDQQIAQQSQAGNIVPLQEVANANIKTGQGVF